MRLPTLFLCILVLAVLAGGVGLLLYFRQAREKRILFNERKAEEALWWISNAEVTFRERDFNVNGVGDFWTDDVAGLNYLGTPTGPGRSGSIQLIPRELATADADPRGRMPEGTRPYYGYLFRAMDIDPTGAPYRQDTDGVRGKVHNLSRFGFCAWPAEYGITGRQTLWLNDGRSVVYYLDNGGKPILRMAP